MKIQTCSNIGSITFTASLSRYVYDRVKEAAVMSKHRSPPFDRWLHQQLLFADYNKA
jgi:hypothetical protein